MLSFKGVENGLNNCLFCYLIAQSSVLLHATALACDKIANCVISVLGFKSVKGQADLEKRLDLEIKAVDKKIGQNAYLILSEEQPIRVAPT